MSQTPIYDQLCRALAQPAEQQEAPAGRRRAAEGRAERIPHRVPEAASHSVAEFSGSSGKHRRPTS